MPQLNIADLIAQDETVLRGKIQLPRRLLNQPGCGLAAPATCAGDMGAKVDSIQRHAFGFQQALQTLMHALQTGGIEIPSANAGLIGHYGQSKIHVP